MPEVTKAKIENEYFKSFCKEIGSKIYMAPFSDYNEPIYRCVIRYKDTPEEYSVKSIFKDLIISFSSEGIDGAIAIRDAAKLICRLSDADKLEAVRIGKAIATVAVTTRDPEIVRLTVEFIKANDIYTNLVSMGNALHDAKTTRDYSKELMEKAKEDIKATLRQKISAAIKPANVKLIRIDEPKQSRQMQP